MEVRIKGGISVIVPQDLSMMTPYVLLEQENWFEGEIEFVRRLILPGMFVIDVGANYGTYALCAAALVGEGGQVIAFEPASATAAYLRRSVAANSFRNMRIFQCALSDHVGEATLSLSANAELNTLQSTPGSVGELVRLRTLDDCFDELGSPSIDFLKLDAEGEETNVIRGGKRLLGVTSPLVMFELRHADRVNSELWQEFGRIGYQIYTFMPGPSMLVPFDPNARLDPFQLNLFAAKGDCAAKLEHRGLLAILSNAALPQSSSIDEHWFCYLQKLPYARRFLPRWSRFRRRNPGLLRSFLGSLPYAKSVSERWNVFRGGSDAGSRAYLDALNDYARAYLPETPAGYRPSFLARSLASLSKLLEGKPRTFARLSTWARVASDAGQRELARKICVETIEAIDSGRIACDADEPFLSATERLDKLDPGVEPGRWCMAGFLEAAVRLGHYSSYFTGTATLDNLERLAESGYQSPEMERRRQLVRMQSGLQCRPGPHPTLEAQTPDNLNSDRWRDGWP